MRESKPKLVKEHNENNKMDIEKSRLCQRSLQFLNQLCFLEIGKRRRVQRPFIPTNNQVKEQRPDILNILNALEFLTGLKWIVRERQKKVMESWQLWNQSFWLNVLGWNHWRKN